MVSQSKKLELGVMIGNNGQLDRRLDDFYNFNLINRGVPNKYRTQISNKKFSAFVRYSINERFSVRVKIGKAFRTEIYTQTEPKSSFKYSIYQTVSNINPSVCFSTIFGKYELMTGVEIPLMFVGNFIEKTNYTYSPDTTIYPPSNIRFTTNGGFIWGVNNFIGCKYALTDRIKIGSEISYGLLFANLGNKFIAEDLDPNSGQYNQYYESYKKHKGTFFSAPEVSVGVFIQLGNSKVKK